MNKRLKILSRHHPGLQVVPISGARAVNAHRAKDMAHRAKDLIELYLAVSKGRWGTDDRTDEWTGVGSIVIKRREVPVNSVAWAPPKEYPNNELSRILSVPNTGFAHPSVRWFADRAYGINGVTGVYCRSEEAGTTLVIRTVVNRDDYELRADVYEVEGQTLDEFPNQRMDFLVITDVTKAAEAAKALATQGFKLIPEGGEPVVALDPAFVAKAEHNRAFLDSVNVKDTPFLDWVVTVAFYTALRWVDAYFSPDCPVDHPERNGWVRARTGTRTVYNEYRELYNQSRDARYGLRAFTPEEVAVLIQNRLSRIVSHMSKQ